jgi:hypothetical protein
MKVDWDDVQNYIGSAIQQYDVSANQHMCGIWRWRRKPPLEVYGNRLKAFLEPRRESATPHQLFFQSWRQTVFLGKSGWQIILVFVVPSAHGVAVMILIEMFTLVVIITVFIVALTISVTLSQREIAGEHENSQHAGEHPF